MLNKAIGLLVFIGLLLVIGVGVARKHQEKFIFYPVKLPANFPFKFPVPHEEVFIPTASSMLNALYFPAENAQGSVLFLHGNYGGLEAWGLFGAEFIRRAQWNILIIDYPGYGKSTGHISSEKQLHEVGLRSLEWLRAKTPKAKVVVFGHSVGTGIATHLAAVNKVEGLILESPFFSYLELFNERFKFAPPFLMRYHFLNHAWLKKVSVPALLLHGTEDKIMPYSHSLRLVNLAPPRSGFVTFEGGEYGTLTGYGNYWPSINTYLMAR